MAELKEAQTGEDLLALNAELIQEKRQEFGLIQVYRCPQPFQDELLIVAGPQNNKLFHALVNTLQDEKKDRAVALENFATDCTVHPERQRVREIFKKLPAFALAVAAKAQELAGTGFEELGKG